MTRQCQRLGWARQRELPARRGAGGPAESAGGARGPGRAGGRAATAAPGVPWANAAHKLNDSGQLSSASPTPVPARPSPGDSAGVSSSPGTYSRAVSGVARKGLGRRQRIQV